VEVGGPVEVGGESSIVVLRMGGGASTIRMMSAMIATTARTPATILMMSFLSIVGLCAAGLHWATLARARRFGCESGLI